MEDDDGGVAAEVMHRYGRSGQPESQQVVAVLRAVTDVIKAEGLALSPTSYFAAVMSALEKPDTQASSQVVLAMLTLLSTVLPRTPNTVLRSKFAGSAALVGGLLTAHAGDAATAKAALGCLAQVLAAADPKAWLSAVPAFNQLLAFVTDNRPKVRKRSHTGLVEVLGGLQRSPALGAASELVAKMAQRVLPGPAAAAHAAAAASNKQRAAAEEAITRAVSDALHAIAALKGVLPLMEGGPAKSVVELLLKLLPLRQPLLERHVAEALAALAGGSTTRLSGEELGQLMGVVIDTESLWVGGGRDPGLLMALGKLLEGGLARLAERDPAACAARLPRAVHALVPQLAAEQDGVRYGAAQALRTLITDCLTADVVAAARKKTRGSAPGAPTALGSLVAAVAATLSARYQDAWGMALPVVGALVERLGELDAADAAAPLLEGLGAILAGAMDAAEDADAAAAAGGGDDDAMAGGDRTAVAAAAAAHAGAAEATLGTALRALGPEAVLQVLPLRITEGLEGTAEPRTWLLPLLRKYVRHARLAFWHKELLPLAVALGARAAALSAAGGAASASLAVKCRALELQVWHCLPAFMSWAVDLPAAYTAAVKSMAAAFNNRPDLHAPICLALQRAASQVRHVLAADGRGPEFVGYADPAAHGPTSGPGGGSGADGDDEDEDGGGGAAEDPATAAAHGGAPPAGYGAAEAEAALGALRAFNKQWLSVLCKAYLDSEPEARGHVSAAVAALAAVTDANAVAGFFRAALQKLAKIITDEAADVPPPDPVTEGGSTPAARRNAFLELACWLSYGLPDSAVDALFKAVKSALVHGEAAVQKRGFKVMAHVAEARGSWLGANLGEVLRQLLGPTAVSTLSAARRYRLRLVRPVVVALQRPGTEVPRGVLAAASGGDEDMEGDGGSEPADPHEVRRQLVAALVADIVLCTKEANKKTRAAAYDLLVGLAHVMDEQDPGAIHDSDSEDGMDERQGGAGKGGLYEFFSMVMGGLVATTPHMVSATVLALARLTYEFAAAMQNVVASLLPPVLSLLRGKAREVVKAVLGFVKVCAMRLPVDMLLPQLGSILEGMLIWAEDSKNKFKLKVRVIVERLARRCGFDAVSSAMPPSDSKLLAHIRKEHQRKQRRKHGAGSESGSQAGDGDARSRRSGAPSSRSSMARTARASQWGHTAIFSDEDGGSEGDGGAGRTKSVRSAGGKAAAAARGGRSGGAVQLPGGGAGSDPMNLLDAAASRQLVRSAAGIRPGAAGGDGERREAFKRDPASGKMVIDEEEDGEGRKGGKKRRRGRDEDGYDSDDSDFDDLKGVADLKYALKKAGESKSVRFAKSLDGRSDGGRSAGGRSAGGRSVGGRSAGGMSTGSKAGSQAGGKGAHSGERFKSKRGGGDVKGKAKVEPYAYWSLDRRMLNRRRGKQAAAANKLASVVGGAQAGALKGAKAKRAGAGRAGGGAGPAAADGARGSKGPAKRQRTEE